MVRVEQFYIIRLIAPAIASAITCQESYYLVLLVLPNWKWWWRCAGMCTVAGHAMIGDSVMFNAAAGSAMIDGDKIRTCATYYCSFRARCCVFDEIGGARDFSARRGRGGVNLGAYYWIRCWLFLGRVHNIDVEMMRRAVFIETGDLIKVGRVYCCAKIYSGTAVAMRCRTAGIHPCGQQRNSQ